MNLQGDKELAVLVRVGSVSVPPDSLNQPSLGGRFPACEAREHAYIGAARPSWQQIVDTSAFAGDLSS